MSKAMARCDHGKRSSQNRISSHSVKAAAIKKGHPDERVVGFRDMGTFSQSDRRIGSKKFVPKSTNVRRGIPT